MDLSCLNNVIGLSQVDCIPCAPEKPDDWEQHNISYSGHYLNNTEFVVDFAGTLKKCDKDIYQLMIDSRKAAINDLRGHLINSLSMKHSPLFGNINGTVGIPSHNQINSISTEAVGVKIKPKYCVGTVLKFKKISLTIDKPQSYVINLLCVETGENKVLGEIAGGGNSPAILELSESIYLNGEKTFLIWYERNGGYPLDYTIIPCTSCGTKPDYWSQVFVDGVGIQNGQIAHTKNLSYGLQVQFCLQCDFLSWMCSVDESFWCTDPFGTLFAKLLQMYSSMKFNEAIQGVVNPILKEKILIRNKGIKENLNALIYALCDKLPRNASDCLCKKSLHNARIAQNLVT